MRTYLLAAMAATLGFMPPLAASAQDVPSYAEPQDGDQQGDQQIRGRVIAFDGAYSVSVRDDQGYVDNVQLHQGTIINPTGITIAPGMVVSILGYNAGNYFTANEVDTPYSYDAGVPYYEGHPWNYYGPSISLGFFFGSVGWWHGGDFNGPYHYDGGRRIYNDVHITNVYRNGNFQGRNYVAPASRGGYVVNNRTNVENVRSTTTYNGDARRYPNAAQTQTRSYGQAGYQPRTYGQQGVAAPTRTYGTAGSYQNRPTTYGSQTRTYATSNRTNAVPQTRTYTQTTRTYTPHQTSGGGGRTAPSGGGHPAPSGGHDAGGHDAGHR